MIKNPLLLLFVLSFATPYRLLAQEDESNTKQLSIHQVLSLSDEIYGLNDELINGCVYNQSDYRIQGHPYFYSDQWQTGTFYIHGKRFSGLKTKYNLVANKVVINVTRLNENEIHLDINKNQVDSFQMGNSLFINSKCFQPDSSDLVFYEKITGGNPLFGWKYVKRFVEMYSSSAPKGKFSDQKKSLYFIGINRVVEIDKKSSFLDLFDEVGQKTVKQFMNAQKINLNKSSAIELQELMDFCIQQNFVQK